MKRLFSQETSLVVNQFQLVIFNPIHGDATSSSLMVDLHALFLNDLLGR